MVDSIGRMRVGDTRFAGKKRKNIVQNVRTKMELWRDAARAKLLAQRRRYKLKVERNKRLMKARKKEREKSLNPSFFPTLPELYDSLLRFQISLSTVPPKPKYSRVKPAQRLYGLLLRKKH